MEIEIRNVSKTYGNQLILDDVSVKFLGGTIYGLVGVNGSGKSTLMRCICGFTKPDKGEIIVGGKRIGVDVDFPQSVGIIIETPGFLPHYSGLRNLSILAGVSLRANRARVIQAMEMVKLDPSNRKPVKQYSLGMRQRLGIAQAILEDPEILLLDEPFNGLDQEGISDIHHLLKEQKTRGKTIILVSHNLKDISLACDQVYSLEEGKLIKFVPLKRDTNNHQT